MKYAWFFVLWMLIPSLGWTQEQTCDVMPGCLQSYVEALTQTRTQLEKEIIRLRYELSRAVEELKKIKTEQSKSNTKGGETK